MPQTYTIRIIVRAKKNEVQEQADGTLRVRLTTPPIDGKANEALQKLLAQHFGIAKSRITIVSGEKSRIKKIQIS